MRLHKIEAFRPSKRRKNLMAFPGMQHLFLRRDVTELRVREKRNELMHREGATR
jgi:hypothetical protein